MNNSLRCGIIAASCLALGLVMGGCPSVTPSSGDSAGREAFASAPVFSPPGGFYAAAVDVQIVSSTLDAQIYYTTDQSVPSDTNGQLYDGPIHVDQAMIIRAVAYADGLSPSVSTTASYTIGGSNNPPVVSSATVAGALSPGQSGTVTVTCQASDPDGDVVSVVADLSELSGSDRQPLVHQTGTTWSWRGEVQPVGVGIKTVTLIVTDNDNAVATADATIAVGLTPGTQEWAFGTDGIVRSGPAVADDGTIYIGSQDGYLYAFNANGSLKWKCNTSSTIAGSPAIGSDGTIYVAGDNGLFAFLPTGDQKWSFMTSGGSIGTSPAVGTRNVVYVGTTDGKLYAVDANGNSKWPNPAALGGPILSSPAIGADGTIYVGCNDGKFYALYPDGTQRWSYLTGANSPVMSSPAIDSDGTIYVGSSNGMVYAFQPNGAIKWRVSRITAIDAPPVLGWDDVLYVGSESGVMTAINTADGTLRWEYMASGAISAAAAVASDGTVYFGSDDRNLYAVDQDGDLVWNFVAADGVNGSPVIGPDGVVYVGSDDRYVYALYGTAGPADSPWAVFHGNLKRTGAAVDLPISNLPPVVISKSAVSDPAAAVGRKPTVTVTVQVKDFDGSVQSAVADLSALGGSASAAMTLASGDTYKWSGELQLTDVGTYTIVVTATDNEGATVSTNVPFKVLALPAISNQSLTGALAWSKPASVTYSCDIADPDGTVTSVTADLSAIGGSPTQLLAKGQGSSYTWTGDVTPTTVGAKNLTVTASDKAGTLATANFQVTVADVPLISDATVSGPKSNAVGVGSPSAVTVSCTVTNVDDTVASVQADLSKIGGASSVDLVKGANNVWSYTGTVTAASQGTQAVTLTAKDSRGGTSTATATIFVLAPTNIALNAPTPFERGEVSTVTVSCTVTDPVGTVKSVTADLRAIGGGAAQSLTGPDANDRWTLTVQVVPPAMGETVITCTATDDNDVVGTGSLTFHFTSATMAINNPQAVGMLYALRAGSLTVSCEPFTSDGTIAVVTFKSDDLGVPNEVDLLEQAGGVWSLTTTVTPQGTGVKTVTFNAQQQQWRLGDARDRDDRGWAAGRLDGRCAGADGFESGRSVQRDGLHRYAKRCYRLGHGHSRRRDGSVDVPAGGAGPFVAGYFAERYDLCRGR